VRGFSLGKKTGEGVGGITVYPTTNYSIEAKDSSSPSITFWCQRTPPTDNLPEKGRVLGWSNQLSLFYVNPTTPCPAERAAGMCRAHGAHAAHTHNHPVRVRRGLGRAQRISRRLSICVAVGKRQRVLGRSRNVG